MDSVACPSTRTVPASCRISSAENVSGGKVVPSAVPVRVIELTVPPTLDELFTSIVMSAEKANDPEESPGHCEVQRLAVIGLGRTTTLNVLPDPVVESTPEGPVALLLQPSEAVRARKPRPARSLFTLSPNGRCRGNSLASRTPGTGY